MGGGVDTILFNEQNAAVFGDYIGNRYPGLPKLLGGDTNRFWVCVQTSSQYDSD